MTELLTLVHQLQQMLADNPLPTMLSFLLIVLVTACISAYRFVGERLRRSDEVKDRQVTIDLATTFSTSLTSQTEINRQMAAQMEIITATMKDMAKTVRDMHKSNLRYFRTHNERLAQIEADIQRLKEAH